MYPAVNLKVGLIKKYYFLTRLHCIASHQKRPRKKIPGSNERVASAKKMSSIVYNRYLKPPIA